MTNYSPDGKHLATGGMNQTIRLTDLESGKGLLTGQHHSTVQTVTFSPDGTRLATGVHDKTVRVWLASRPRNTPALDNREK